MAKTPGATLYTSNHASGSETLSSFLYAGRGRLRHHAGISGFGCWAGVGTARSPASENAKRINRFKEVFSSSPRLLLFFTRKCVIAPHTVSRVWSSGKMEGRKKVNGAVSPLSGTAKTEQALQRRIPSWGGIAHAHLHSDSCSTVHRSCCFCSQPNLSLSHGAHTSGARQAS